MNSKKLPSKPIYSLVTERASVSASGMIKGSITAEAAMVVPLFFLAVVSLLYLLEMMAVKTAVRSGMQYAGKEAAQEAYAVTMLLPGKVESDLVRAVGSERMDRSIIEGGSTGVTCGKSYLSARTGIGEIVASYQIKIPVPIFGIEPIKQTERMKIKAWTGYEKAGFGNEREEIVYITETGLVYHKDYHCTHLDLSIHMSSSEEIEGMRNESGGKYYPCEQCKGNGKEVYVTNTGDRYHSTLSCSGLKRTIYAVPVSEAIGKGACSRCGQ